MLENYKHYEENWVHLTGGLEVWDEELGNNFKQKSQEGFYWE